MTKGEAQRRERIHKVMEIVGKYNHDDEFVLVYTDRNGSRQYYQFPDEAHYQGFKAPEIDPVDG